MTTLCGDLGDRLFEDNSPVPLPALGDALREKNGKIAKQVLPGTSTSKYFEVLQSTLKYFLVYWDILGYLGDILGIP